MSPKGLIPFLVSVGFPRVSGDEPVESTLKRVVPSFSPRERG